MEEILVSLIVPIYNVEKYIQRCVESLISLTYQHIEIILVDDGSPDQCPMICDKYEDMDNRIKVIHKENGGLSDARNAGLEASTGDYIMFIDSDDYVEANLIERAMSEVEINKPDVVILGYYSDFVDTEEKLIFSEEIGELNGRYIKDHFKEIPLSKQLIGILGYAWNKLYRTEVIKSNNHKFTKGLSLVEDIVFNGPVLETCNSISFIEDPLVHYMHRPRETLGAKFYDNHFELKRLAMESVKSLLLFWGHQEDEVERMMNIIGFDALKSTTRILSQSNNYNGDEKNYYLKKLYDEKEVKKILTNVALKSAKDKFIRIMMINGFTKILLKTYTYR